MREIRIGRVDDWTDPGHQVVRMDGHEVGVFRRGGNFYAYSNYCLHQGGPACEGRVVSQVVAAFTPGGEWIEDRFSPSEIHFVCPWHGWEYLLESGRCAADPTLALTKYEVLQRDGYVYLAM